MKPAWLFGIITGSFGIFASFLWSFLSFNYTPDKAISPSSLVLTPVIITLQLFAVTFYCLLVFSFLRQNKSSMKSTFRIVAYSQSAMILYAIPFFGSILSPVLWFYMLVTGLHHANSVGKLKTTLILIFPVIFIVFVGIVALSAFLAGNLFANEQLTNFFNLFPG
ncbi:MAG TPA: YIP1 family protein [Mariniphaga sp.]|nr:YIP1 family protein [Mariniphaga sp.]